MQLINKIYILIKFVPHEQNNNLHWLKEVILKIKNKNYLIYMILIKPYELDTSQQLPKSQQQK